MRPLVDQHPCTYAENFAVAGCGYRHVHCHLVGVPAGQQVLHPVLNPFHRTVNLAREERQDNRLRVGRSLDPELSADISGNDPDSVLRKPHDVRYSRTH